jgi:hypothetical protein
MISTIILLVIQLTGSTGTGIVVTDAVQRAESEFTRASNRDVNVYFGNLHAHTSYSDGTGTPEEAYAYARNIGKLDYIALTEHNHELAERGAQDRADGVLIALDHSLYSGAREDSLIQAAIRHTVDDEFVAIYGQEFSSISKGNHVNVFDAPEVITTENGDFHGLLEWLADNPDSQGNP